MIKLGIIIIASSTMALSSAVMQDTVDDVKTADNTQLIQQDSTNNKTPQLRSDNNSTVELRLLKDPLKRGRSLHTKTITKELIEDCLEVAREINPQLAMWLDRLKTKSSKQKFEHALQRNARYLLGLVELRERNPVLYDFKMRELKTGSEIKEVTKLLQEAVDTQSSEQVEMLEIRLRELIRMQASYSIESRGRYLLRIQEHAAALEQQINDQAITFDETAEQQLQDILNEIKSNSKAMNQDPVSG